MEESVGAWLCFSSNRESAFNAYDNKRMCFYASVRYDRIVIRMSLLNAKLVHKPPILE